MNSECINSREGGSCGDVSNSSQQKGRPWAFFYLFFICLCGWGLNIFMNSSENSAVQGSWGQNDGEVALLYAEKVKIAAKSGPSTAATKAKMFADHEVKQNKLNQ